MRRMLLLLTALLLLLVGGLLLWYGNGCRIVGDQLCTPKTTQLDLSGESLPDLEELTVLSKLELLNLRDTGLTPAQYDYLQEALPQCQILWLIPFQGSYYPQDTQHLSLDHASEEDLHLLTYFSQLQTLDASGCTDAATLLRLQESLPNCDVSYSVLLNGQRQPEDAQSLILGGDSVAALENALKLLPLVREVDATQCWDYAGLLQLQQQYPQVAIRYQVTISGTIAQNQTTKLKITDPQLGELKVGLAYLPQLQQVELLGQLPGLDQLYALQQQYPQVEFLYTVSLFGATFSTDAENLDLSGRPVTDLTALEQALRCMKKLTKVELHNCGIPSQDIDALAQKLPHIQFIWTVNVGGIAVRTDATTLMPFSYGVTLTDADTAELRYCTQMRCMDLGHQQISDVSFLAYMPKLQYLTLAENPISDISSLAGLEELVFLELFLTNVRDYSPLLGCKKLQDLNISYAIPSDMSVLVQLKQLKHLHLKGLWQDSFQEQLEEALPNTTLVFAGTGDISSTGDGWRKLENYFRMRDLLDMPYMTY